METKKARTPKKANEEPVCDVLFWERFGYRVSPAVARAFRCNACDGFRLPLRKSVWACEKQLCGKLLDESEIFYRLSLLIPSIDKLAISEIVQIVREHQYA